MGLEDLLHCLKERLHSIAIEEGRVHELAWRLVEIDLALWEEWMIEESLAPVEHDFLSAEGHAPQLNTPIVHIKRLYLTAKYRIPYQYLPIVPYYGNQESEALYRFNSLDGYPHSYRLEKCCRLDFDYDHGPALT